MMTAFNNDSEDDDNNKEGKGDYKTEAPRYKAN